MTTLPNNIRVRNLDRTAYESHDTMLRKIAATLATKGTVVTQCCSNCNKEGSAGRNLQKCSRVYSSRLKLFRTCDDDPICSAK